MTDDLALPMLPADTPFTEIADGEYFLHDGPGFPDPRPDGQDVLQSRYRSDRLSSINELERRFKVVVIKGGRIVALRYSITGALYIPPESRDLPVDFPTTLPPSATKPEDAT